MTETDILLNFCFLKISSLPEMERIPPTTMEYSQTFESAMKQWTALSMQAASLSSPTSLLGINSPLQPTIQQATMPTNAHLPIPQCSVSARIY